jgi:hypothetical protein
MIWYDGGKTAPQELLGGHQMKREGIVVVGSKGKLYSAGGGGGGVFYDGAEEVEVEYPKSPGHFTEWVEAIKGGPPAMSNFPDYATGLTETILLGNLAVWAAPEPGVGEKVEWDAKRMKCTNIDGLEPIIKPEYREGYTLDA